MKRQNIVKSPKTEVRRQEAVSDCQEVLRNMSKFSYDVYFRMLMFKGYEVKRRYDKHYKLVGYTIGKEASVFKASELSRNLTVSRLEDYWRRLHSESFRQEFSPRPCYSKTNGQHGMSMTEKQKSPKPATVVRYVDLGNRGISFDIPKIVNNEIEAKAVVPEDNDVASVKNVAQVAMLLFVGYLEEAAAASENCGGGGSSPQSGWGRDRDEDDIQFARRCLQMAHSMCKPKPRKRSRGWHR